MEGTKREYSRRQKVQGLIKQSRIDLVLCTKKVENKTRNVLYKEAGYSDHDCLFMKLDFDEVERGPGILVLNTSILNDRVYCER